MDQAYRQHYRELFEKHWWWRARTDFILKKLESLHTADSRWNILDVGCGEGLLFEKLSRFGDVEGIELEEQLLSESKWRDRIFTCKFDDSFQPGKKYSLILMLDVLEHLPNPEETLGNVRRLLAPGGIFVATVPAFRSLWTNHDVLNEHKTRYTKNNLRRIVEAASMSVSDSRYFFQWTVPAKLFVRSMEFLFSRPPKVPEVPFSALNESLYLISRAEQETVGRMDLPIGSSLLMVARA